MLEIENQLMQRFLDTHAIEAAAMLEKEAVPTIVAILSEVQADCAADVLCHFNTGIAVACLNLLPLEKATKILGALPHGIAANLARKMPNDRSKKLIEAQPEIHRIPLQRSMSFEESTVGAAMDAGAFTLTEDLTVDQALERVRQNAGRIKYYLYIVDRNQKLVGVLNLRDFMLAESGVLLSTLMRATIASLKPDAKLKELEHAGVWGNFLSLPVTDKDGHFLGVLSANTTRQVAGKLSGNSEKDQWSSLLGLKDLFWTGFTGVMDTVASRKSKTTGEGSDGKS